LEFQSAGIEAHGKNRRVLQVMQEAGLDISGQESTRLTDDMLNWAELVVTVCGHADEHCPVLPPGTRKEHWPLNDPAKATGNDTEIITVFRTSRDEIRQRVESLIARLRSERVESEAPPV
jgi:arsenate reductase